MSATTSEAARLHEANVASFKAVIERFEDSRVEQRRGYVFLVCPPAAQIPAANGVWVDVDGDEEAAADLARAAADLEALGLPFWLQTRQGRHPAVEAEAARLGLALVDAEPGMVATAADLIEPPQSDLDISRVADNAGLAEAHAVASAGFEIAPDALEPFYSPVVTAMPGVANYVGYVDGRPVSTAVGVMTGDAVGIFNVATPPEYRRRGYGAALTARAAVDGFGAGADLAYLQASESGERVYRRLGFREVERYRLFARDA